jgi:hypothetical protein
MTISRTQFDRELAEILIEENSCGFYSRQGLGPNGVARVHHFSLAVGLGSRHWLGRYTKRLKVDEPSWTELANPYHVVLMCRLAIEHRRRLPRDRPELPTEQEN